MAINVDVRIERLIPNTNAEATVLIQTNKVKGIETDDNGVVKINSVQELFDKTTLTAATEEGEFELLQMVYLLQAGMKLLIVDEITPALTDKLLYNYRFITKLTDTEDLTGILGTLLDLTDAELILEGNTATNSVDHAKVTYVDNAGIVGMRTRFLEEDLGEIMEEKGILAALAFMVRKAKLITAGTPWLPVAGHENGRINEFTRLLKQVGNIEKENLLTNGVNPTILKPGVGAVIVGNNTSLFTKPGEETNPLVKSNITTLAIEVKRALYNIAEEMMFKLNNSKTWTLTRLAVEDYMRPILNQGGIEAYNIQVGLGETMTPEDVRNGILRLHVNYTPTFAIEEISVTVTITENEEGFLIEVDGGL